MKIAVIGTGYVGLVSGVCFASKGHHVTCVDKNPLIIDKLNSGEPTIHEKDLPRLLKLAINQGNFFATNNFDAALSDASIVIIAVGTPSQNGKIDLSNVLEASRQIGKYIAGTDRYISVIVKSTVIPGTTDTLVREEIEKSSQKKIGKFGLGMNPEFLREGNAIKDFMFPDRIVLGFEDNKTLSNLDKLYLPWDVDKLRVNSRTAELIKYANNVILATQISTMNEIANLANKIGKIDMQEVIKGVHLDKRWNPIAKNSRLNPEILKYLKPGCGFGGSCFTKDIEAIRDQGKKLKLPMSIMSSVLDVNNAQPYKVSQMLEFEIGKLLNKKILLLGLAFKPETDDVRDSPSIKIATDLINKGVNLFAHDPVAEENFKNSLDLLSSKIKFVKKWQEILNEIEVIIIVTPWEEYFSIIDLKIENKIIFDTRGFFSKKELINAKYLSI
jgi:UDPglucose 6-dehydrogenase/GDP-mannose 6-dehydrogenase